MTAENLELETPSEDNIIEDVFNQEKEADEVVLETPEVSEALEVTPEVKPAEPAPAVTPAAPADLAAQIAAELQKVQPQAQQEEPPKDLTPEERAKILNEWNPDDSFATEFAIAMIDPDVTPEQRLAALNKMRDGMRAEARTYTELMVKAALQNVQQTIQPFQAQQLEAARVKVENDFYGQFNQLNPKDHGDLVRVVAQQVRAEGSHSGDAAVTEVGNRVYALLKITASQTPGTAPVAQPQVGNRQPMSSTKLPQGAGASSSNAASGNDIADIFS